MANTVFLIALHKETSLHQPSKALIRNVVARDVCFLRRTCFSCILVLHSARTVANLLHSLLYSRHWSHHFLSCVSVHIDRHKRGQTSSDVAGTQVQTNCNTNTKASLCGECHLLGFFRCLQCYTFDFQSRHMESLVDNLLNTVFDNIPVLLHQNFRQATPPIISSS